MKNLIAELLVKLAEKEDESKELVAQVEALEIVVTAMLRHLDEETLNQLTRQVSAAMAVATQDAPIARHDARLLAGYVQKLLVHPRR
ncbi:anti-adapter protein IraP [Pantoea sp. 1.19]|uniref:anti-adapter protein IraP n=1 Tax=Pantoea sp. 1.19 TaxID=1925589 RepID=UPI000948D1C5|nr:anti-adapter protein IraP [Pantoea sp. 1.19]